MMKLMKRATALIAVLCLTLSCASASNSTFTSPGNPTFAPRAWNQLLKCVNGFDLSADGKVTIYGSTMGYDDSTEVRLTVEVQRQKITGGGWSAVPGMTWELTTTDDFRLVVSKERWVVTGYTYRLRTFHSATGPYGTDTSTQYSSVYGFESDL